MYETKETKETKDYGLSDLIGSCLGMLEDLTMRDIDFDQRRDAISAYNSLLSMQRKNRKVRA